MKTWLANHLRLWLAARFLMHQASSSQPNERWYKRLGLPAWLSFLGLAFGVACLTVSMAVVSGFEATLKGALVDVFGHLLVVKRGEETLTFEKASEKIREALPETQGMTPFINLEAIVVGQQKLNGVVIQGIDLDTVETVLRLRPRVIKGEFNVIRKNDASPAQALVGKALAERFSLDVGSEFRAVLPKPSPGDTTSFTSKVARFQVAGIIDLGKAEYDERTVITSIDEARKLAAITAPFTGLRVRIKDADRAPKVAEDLVRALGPSWWVMDWTEGNRNLLRAIQYERVPIFVVILMMVIAASFNVASNIFIGVLRRTSEISILRALGFSHHDIAVLFRMQGLVFGVVGTIFGLLAGVVLGGLFVLAQNHFALLPASVYRLSHIGVDFRLLDVVVVSIVAILICLLASLKPAARAARLDPVEGLRHE